VAIRISDTDTYPDPDRDTGKTCLGGGIHCPSASSCSCRVVVLKWLVRPRMKVFWLSLLFRVAAWLSGSALVSINTVTLRRARLVLGWPIGDRLQVGKPPRFMTSHSR